jgi:hypothetical protein
LLLLPLCRKGRLGLLVVYINICHNNNNNNNDCRWMTTELWNGGGGTTKRVNNTAQNITSSTRVPSLVVRVHACTQTQNEFMEQEHLDTDTIHSNNSTTTVPTTNDIVSITSTIKSSNNNNNNNNNNIYDDITTDCIESCSFVRSNIKKEICQQVIRQKLLKRRHLVISKLFDTNYLHTLFPTLLQHFCPQSVQYNGGIAQITTWKISCYLEVMADGIPTAQPNLVLCRHFLPLLDMCNALFLFWYQQQHSCNHKKTSTLPSTNTTTTTTTTTTMRCRRLMTFITRYTAAPNEQALLKVRISVGMEIICRLRMWHICVCLCMLVMVMVLVPYKNESQHEFVFFEPRWIVVVVVAVWCNCY